MLELRKDYVLDRWVIVSEKRGGRPKQFHKAEKIRKGFCFFCPGNEKTTPKEIGRIEENGKWLIRWFPNKFPAAAKNGSPKLNSHGYAYGYHEVIAETPDHKKQFAGLGKEHIKKLLKVYAGRIKELSKKKGIKYVLIFKNHGREGGTSLVHSHTQVMAYNKIPELVKQETGASIKGKKCRYCSIIRKEAESERFAKQNKNFIAFCPYASRFNYEAWIFSKKHIRNITEMNDEQLDDLAEMMKFVLSRVDNIADSYNFFIHYAPKGKDLHFHIEVCPRIAVWGGYELGSDEVINSIKPEKAAEYYKYCK